MSQAVLHADDGIDQYLKVGPEIGLFCILNQAFVIMCSHGRGEMSASREACNAYFSRVNSKLCCIFANELDRLQRILYRPYLLIQQKRIIRKAIFKNKSCYSLPGKLFGGSYSLTLINDHFITATRTNHNSSTRRLLFLRKIYFHRRYDYPADKSARGFIRHPLFG